MTSQPVYVASNLPFDAGQWKRLEDAIGPNLMMRVDPADEAASAEALRKAKVAILSGDLDERHLGAPNLRWIHCDHSGLTKSARPEIFRRGLLVTGSAGRSAPALAEHVMMFALLLGSRYPDFYESQKRHEWRRTPDMAGLRALCGRTIGILGMGKTGMELAKRAKAFEMRVLGYRRRDLPVPPGVDRMYSTDKGEGINDILKQADILALVLNLSNDTYHLIGRDEIALMKSSAIIINLARGQVVDQDALVDALRSNRLAGAGLDVTTPEPLPRDHPLWDVPNLLITPHFTAAVPDRSERSLAIITENLRRYKAGETLLNLLTPEDVYTY
ncbi:D-2-hydroxyacid dehydrogenase [Mesorhizobium sp. CN2-181]|uniref:D-2-hydroxyacid dehydrogenase n=1 Tax=Mesorhizobium yinganensis TaxID=3157707 RepID=UPI0032B83875